MMKWLKRRIQNIKIRFSGGIVVPENAPVYHLGDATALWRHLQENKGEKLQVIDYKPLIDHFNEKSK